MKTIGMFESKNLCARLFAAALILTISFYTGCDKGLEKRTPLPGRGAGFPSASDNFLSPSFGRAGRSQFVDRGRILPLSSLPSMDEELWVIARREEDAPKPVEPLPKCGSMLAKLAAHSTEV